MDLRPPDAVQRGVLHRILHAAIDVRPGSWAMQNHPDVVQFAQEYPDVLVLHKHRS